MNACLFERTLRPTVAALSPLRQDVAATFGPSVSAPTLRDLLLLISELCTNAIEASRARGDVVVRITASGDGVFIEVEDSGTGFALGENARARDHAETGRGLEIAQAIADDLVVRRHNRRTCVQARLRRNETFQLAGDLQ